MTALLLTTLFAFAATFAVAAIIGTWNAHATAILALRRQMNDCTEMRDFRYSLKTVEVRSMGAKILRPAFTASRRQERQASLRAAA